MTLMALGKSIDFGFRGIKFKSRGNLFFISEKEIEPLRDMRQNNKHMYICILGIHANTCHNSNVNSYTFLVIQLNLKVH